MVSYELMYQVFKCFGQSTACGRDMWHAWERNVYRVLVGRPEGKRPLGRPREDGIRMDLSEAGWRGFGVDLVATG
jgi:hypothetical protein